MYDLIETLDHKQCRPAGLRRLNTCGRILEYDRLFRCYIEILHCLEKSLWIRLGLCHILRRQVQIKTVLFAKPGQYICTIGSAARSHQCSMIFRSHQMDQTKQMLIFDGVFQIGCIAGFFLPVYFPQLLWRRTGRQQRAKIAVIMAKALPAKEIKLRIIPPRRQHLLVGQEIDASRIKQSAVQIEYRQLFHRYPTFRRYCTIQRRCWQLTIHFGR